MYIQKQTGKTAALRRCWAAVVLTGTGVITDDPLFIDGPNNDLRLQPTSPCIDTGVIV